jgi:hypothetical protein
MKINTTLGDHRNKGFLDNFGSGGNEGPLHLMVFELTSFGYRKDGL